MHSSILLYKHSSIHYRYGGSGNEIIFCLHGYAESANSFDFLENGIGNDYTIIAIDLPYHGLTQWQEGLHFSVQELTEIMRTILTARGRAADAAFTLIGFSMGGRAALSLTQAIPHQVKRLVLLAPDGLKMNGWYWLATQTTVGNALFRFTMRYPGWVFFLLNTGNKLRLINQSVFKFAKFYINDGSIRKALYNRWTSMRHITPNLNLVKRNIRLHRIPVRLFFGRFDRIILPQPGERFRNGIEEWCTIMIMQAGHQLLQEKHIVEIRESLRV